MSEEQPSSAVHALVSIFQKVSSADRASEKARLARRAKRNAAKGGETGSSGGATTPAGAQTPTAPPPQPEKRLSKKDRKAAESRMTDAQQQKSANETARMAMGLGTTGKFQKQYSWLKNSSAASPAASRGQTPTRANAGSNSGTSTPGGGRTAPSIPQRKMLGEWSENEDRAIQARDILLVLESDGKAIKALSRGYNTPDKPEIK